METLQKEERVYIYRPYITKNGKKIYPKKAKVFKILVVKKP